ncbi:hypothetical protein [Mesorhizobium sp.]
MHIPMNMGGVFARVRTNPEVRRCQQCPAPTRLSSE